MINEYYIYLYQKPKKVGEIFRCKMTCFGKIIKNSLNIKINLVIMVYHIIIVLKNHINQKI